MTKNYALNNTCIGNTKNIMRCYIILTKILKYKFYLLFHLENTIYMLLYF